MVFHSVEELEGLTPVQDKVDELITTCRLFQFFLPNIPSVSLLQILQKYLSYDQIDVIVEPDGGEDKSLVPFVTFQDQALDSRLGDAVGRATFFKTIKTSSKQNKNQVLKSKLSPSDQCNWTPQTNNFMWISQKFKIPLSEDRRTNKKKLRIVEFNAEWLFINGGHGAIKCPGVQCPWKNQVEADAHLKRVAQLLRSIDADIIHINESEGCAILSLLIKEMGNDGVFKGYLVPGTDTATGQNVALLTKIDPIRPLERTELRVEYPVPGSKCGSYKKGSLAVSKHYLTQFRILLGQRKILDFHLLGCHLLAYPNNPTRCSMREAQAHVLRHFLNEEKERFNSSELIIMGDINDFDEELEVPFQQKSKSRVHLRRFF